MMTKNLFFSMLAMTGMLFATSCSQDELLNEPSTGDFVDATFTIGTTDGIGTRVTIGDALKVDKVACAVYDADGVELDNLYKIENVNEKTATYSVRLAKGQKYRVAFFAYNSTADAYDVTDLKDVKLKDNQLSNVENRDAFSAYVDVEPTTNTINKDVTLYRPFAQLNLGVDKTEWTDAINAGIEVSKTQIKVSNVYTSFSAYDDAVTGDITEMTFGLNQIPNAPEKLEVDVNRDGSISDDEKFYYLALNYLLVGDRCSEKSLTDIELVWEGKDGEKNDPTTNFINIPVQRNYRTNIIGKLLTNPAIFNITIDERFNDVTDFDSPENDYIVDEDGTVKATVASIDELQNALNAANGPTYIKFANNITGSVKITQKAGVDIVIDGDNKTFTGVMTTFGNGRQNGSETLTIKKVQFVASNGAPSCIYSPERSENNAYSYSHNVTVENCTFTDSDGDVNCAAIRHGDGGDKNWTIIGCTVNTGMHSLAQVNNVEGQLIIDGCIVNTKNGANLNSCTNVEMIGCNFDVTGYAVRFGVNSGGNLGTPKNYTITNSTLKSECNDEDAVIMFRASAVDATLTLTNTTVEGTTKVSGATDATTIIGLN